MVQTYHFDYLELFVLTVALEVVESEGNPTGNSYSLRLAALEVVESEGNPTGNSNSLRLAETKHVLVT